MDIDKTRRKLLDATLPHVAFDGWTGVALRAGAADAGLDEAAALNAFPGGAAELIEFFSAEADRKMLAELEKMDLPSMRVRERVAAAVRMRLEQLAPHREAVRRGLGFFALPHNAALGAKCLYRTVDAIWYAAGDTSTDYNFYTKRLLLAGVYSSTLLFWLNDRSEGSAETWSFLERRIGEALRCGRAFGRLAGGLLDLPDRLFTRRPAGVRR
ncbi:MAG: COQ9 family protein [Kiloniellaceae bacterium]